MEYKLQIQDSFFFPLKLKPNAKVLRGLACEELSKETAEFTLSLSKYHSEMELAVFHQHSGYLWGTLYKVLPIYETEIIYFSEPLFLFGR